MNHFADFDPYAIGERNEQTRREEQTLRLEKGSRENGEPNSGSRLANFVSKCTLPTLSRAGLVG